MYSGRGYLLIKAGGFSHSDISGSKPACGSPKLIAANHVLHRLLAPRHPPCALSSLTINNIGGRRRSRCSLLWTPKPPASLRRYKPCFAPPRTRRFIVTRFRELLLLPFFAFVRLVGLRGRDQ